MPHPIHQQIVRPVSQSLNGRQIIKRGWYVNHVFPFKKWPDSVGKKCFKTHYSKWYQWCHFFSSCKSVDCEGPCWNRCFYGFLRAGAFIEEAGERSGYQSGCWGKAVVRTHMTCRQVLSAGHWHQENAKIMTVLQRDPQVEYSAIFSVTRGWLAFTIHTDRMQMQVNTGYIKIRNHHIIYIIKNIKTYKDTK